MAMRLANADVFLQANPFAYLRRKNIHKDDHGGSDSPMEARVEDGDPTYFQMLFPEFGCLRHPVSLKQLRREYEKVSEWL